MPGKTEKEVKFCTGCGAPIGETARLRFCPYCGSPDDGKKFCGECGASLQDLPAYKPPATAAGVGGKKAYCPTCGKEATWISQYSHWYCYGCQKYVSIPPHTEAKK